MIIKGLELGIIIVVIYVGSFLAGYGCGRCIVRKVERKKGKWKLGYCSECGYYWGKDAPIANVPSYCPNCGADMRGKK